jgi:DNA helicase-2/ATP-dependent DNA helicase PcrA
MADAGRERIVDAAINAGRRAAGTGAEAIGLRIGDDVRHAKFGEGIILLIEGEGDKAEAVVRFPEVGEKRLLLAWSPLERVTPRAN